MTALPIHHDPLPPRRAAERSTELDRIHNANPCPSCTWEGYWRILCLRCRNAGADRRAS